MPTRDRLNPRPWHADYIQLRALRAQIAQALAQHGRTRMRVLDVGCRDRPYEPLFAPFASEYIGVDLAEGPSVDVVADARSLPLEDGSVDCVVSTQTLQYFEQPEASVREFARVLRRGGLLLASTHGVGFVDRSAVDRWRWTHHGLRELFGDDGDWTDVAVHPAGGVLSAAAYLLGGQAEFAAHSLGVPWLAYGWCAAANAVAWNGDRVTRRMQAGAMPAAAVNYLIVGVRR